MNFFYNVVIILSQKYFCLQKPSKGAKADSRYKCNRVVTQRVLTGLTVCVQECLCLISHQQLRSLWDGATAKSLICHRSNLVHLYSIMGPVYQLPHNINIVHIAGTSLWWTLLALILSLLPQNLFVNMNHPMSSHIVFITRYHKMFLLTWVTLWALILPLLPQNLFVNMSHSMSSHIAFSIETSSTEITFVRFLSSMYSLMSHHLVLGWKSLWTEAASKGSVLLGIHYICNKSKHS